MKSLLIVIFVALVAAQDDRHVFHPPNRCNLMCPPGQRCFQSGGHWSCERHYPRCDTHRCAHGQVCELVQPTCFRAPCFPIETCLPFSKSVCKTVRCSHGTVCVAFPDGRAHCEAPY